MSTTLDQDMRVILVKLELCAWGGTQAWNASGGGSGEPDARVLVQLKADGTVRDEPPHVRYLRRYNGCRTDEQRREVIRDAESEWAAIFKRPEGAPEGVSEDELILKDYEGKSPEAVALQFGWHPARVRRLRGQNGRDRETGQVTLAAGTSLAEQAVALSEQKLTQTEIARRLEVSQPTVHRLLKFRRPTA